jgi:ABC-type uncharacterized transport system substrate-binding protein
VKRQPRCAGLLAASLILLWGPPATPHPHAYVLYSIVLPLVGETVERIGFVFTFDVLFSAILLRDAGTGDADAVARRHARMLEQIPHEIEIVFNGTPVGLDAPTDLRVSNAGGRLTYRFMIPLRTALRPPGAIDIAVDDPGMFAAFVLRTPDPVDVEGAGAFTAVCDRTRKPTGAPGPVRCDYVASEAPQHQPIGP